MKQAGNNDLFSLRNRLKRIQRDINLWSILTLIIVLFISLPVISIVIELFFGPGESWGHITKFLLWDYVSNSFFLVFVCSFLVLTIGVTTAWLTSRFEFPFRRQMEWLLILPLAIPTYIVAYTYAGTFDYGGSLELIVQGMGWKISRIDIMNKYGLAFVLSIALFPYVYVSARAFFLNQASNLLEASKMLGVGEMRTFFRLMLPLARPAIVAGLILVLMEVLNDYGAAQYYGVSTFTTGIFRAWFSLEEPETAIYLSALLIAIVFTLILFEKWQRKNVRVSSQKVNTPYLQPQRVNKFKGYLILGVVLLPVVLGFFIPILQLLYWGILTAHKVLNYDFLVLSLQSFGLAFFSATVTVFLAVLLIYFSKWNTIGLIKSFSKLGIMGYAIPGAVVAIGIMVPTLAFDKWLIRTINYVFSIKTGLLINGTLVALIYAYCIRFMAVAYNPIESTSLKVSASIPDSSKMLGAGNLRTFLKVEFPLIKTGILSAAILVFMDILKELPLTLILKPYYINTLAVKAYEYASDEMVMEAAIPSLLIVLTATIPVVFLNRLLIKV